MRDPFFVVTTGRAGSVSLALTLSSHPLLCALHECWPWLIPMAEEKCRGAGKSEAELVDLFRFVTPRPAGVQRAGIVDQKLAPFVRELASTFAESQFLWLVRDGRLAVASMYARGWYEEGEQRWPSHAWAKYRVQGDSVGSLQAEEWRQMSAFARCCWYWGWWNGQIRAALEALGERHWLMLRLEDLADEEAGPGLLERVQDWLGVRPVEMQLMHTNQGSQGERLEPLWRGWRAGQRASFARWCGEEMDRLYEWRDRWE
jgi:hypothetical protein